MRTEIGKAVPSDDHDTGNFEIIRNCEKWTCSLLCFQSGERQLRARRLRSYCVFLVIAGAALIRPANAHIVTEEPWHPAAASYRTMLFLADLQPVGGT